MHVIGLMSGTSLDGLDIAYCNFKLTNAKVDYKIVAAETIPYSSEWLLRLKGCMNLSGSELIKFNTDFGVYLGNQVNVFLKQHNLEVPDLVSSHGHTVFHKPEHGYTYQAGCGATLNAITKIKTVCDFRTQDVAFGGQGAPLVPIGDALLFAQHDACLNIGGFSNISFIKNDKRIAFDICPANIILNELCYRLNLQYDEDGKIAQSGSVNLKLMHELNMLDYYFQKAPKSLGKEWLDKSYWAILNNFKISTENLIATCTEHIAYQIAINLKNFNNPLLTGGGVFNSFLISRIQENLTQLGSKTLLQIPDSKIINFKEALIFAFLGYLKVNNQTNTLCSVTGASQNLSTGILYDN